MEKQLSSDLTACMVWGSSPAPDDLPLNLSNLGFFLFLAFLQLTAMWDIHEGEV